MTKPKVRKLKTFTIKYWATNLYSTDMEAENEMEARKKFLDGEQQGEIEIDRKDVEITSVEKEGD